MRQNAAIPSDDAYREPSARADCAKTALKSSNTQSKHLADQQEYYASASALLRKGAFNVSRVHGALSHLPISKTSLRSWMHPKRHFTIARIQSIPSCLPANTPSRSPKSEATLRDYLNPEPLFAIPCIRGAPSHLPEPKRHFALTRIQTALSSLDASKAALHDRPSPRLPFTITYIQSPSCSPESKDPSYSPES